MNEKTIFITGSSGYVGEMLVDQFSKRDDVKQIVGVDIVDPSELTKSNPKLVFIKANLADVDNWREKVVSYQPEIVIHTAWQIRELRDKKMQFKLNITSSDVVFDFAFKNSFVKKLIHFSTVASYGAFADNEIEKLFTEEDQFRKSQYFYAEEKRVVEEHLKLKMDQCIQNGNLLPKVYIIRPASITGPRGRFMRIRFGLQSALSGQLKGDKSFWYSFVSTLVSFTPITPKWCRQFIHEDDINDIVELLSFTDIPSNFEIFNASPSGPVVTGEDMAKAVNKRAVKVHPRIIQFVFFVMRNISLGKIPTSKGGWKSYSYPIAVDGSKITKKYGYQYKMNSLDAFTKMEGRYAEQVK